MPDFMDAVQERVLAATDAAIAETVRQCAVAEGQAECDCGEPISAYRQQQFGARLCVDCANAAEALQASGRRA